MKTDYLIVGSGLSALVFGALMANAGKKVQVLEAHEYPGGFGHSFTMSKKYTFNAQLHYVWDCGVGHPVHQVLKKLHLDQVVTFDRYDPDGFDHMRMPNYALDIPSDSAALVQRLSALFPQDAESLQQFMTEVRRVRTGLRYLSPPVRPIELLQHFGEVYGAIQYLNSTLQQVFDKFKVPLAAQTLLALQWPDFLLPPNQLSFYAWVILFTGYQEGAFYPTQHFGQVIDALVKVITDSGGEVLFNQEVTKFLLTGKTVTGVRAIASGQSAAVDRANTPSHEYLADIVICNIDPKKAASMIGLEQFSWSVRQKLNYQYSPSNFMAYCVVQGIDLRDYGFGKWNTFHSGDTDLNVAFDRMYNHQDYRNPSFAITTPTLLTSVGGDCPADCQIIEFLTVANYGYFKQLHNLDPKDYRQKKAEILESILDVVEKEYVPNFRSHLVFKITGSPTTNEHFCYCPEGNSYGSSLTPRNMGIGRLNHHTSLNNFYFCNASAGYPGFAPTFWTGALLYQRLSGDTVLN
jgi:all-trans-retinol 13,14-reductase